MYICLCRGVTEKEIRREVQRGATSFDEVQERLEVATCCGMCRDSAVAVIDDALQENHDREHNVINLWPPKRQAI